MVSLRQGPVERHLHLLTEIAVAQQVSPAGGLSNCVEHFGFQHIVE
jgi:hypothetical protein